MKTPSVKRKITVRSFLLGVHNPHIYLTFKNA